MVFFLWFFRDNNKLKFYLLECNKEMQCSQILLFVIQGTQTTMEFDYNINLFDLIINIYSYFNKQINNFLDNDSIYFKTYYKIYG